MAPLARAYDVTAHELTHAVTSATANLAYQNESGALNEGLSDILAAVCEAWRDGAISADTWLVGEDIFTPAIAGDALRYMDNPTADKDLYPEELGGSRDYYPERYTGTADNGGVHLNSGIPNLAFHLLVAGGTHPRSKTAVTVPGIGMEKAGQIFYRALTQRFTANTNLAQGRTLTEAAAEDLYPGCTKNAVAMAWAAVGVGAAPPADVTPPARDDHASQAHGTCALAHRRAYAAASRRRSQGHARQARHAGALARREPRPLRSRIGWSSGTLAPFALRLFLLLHVARLGIEHGSAALARTAAARIERKLLGIVRALPGQRIVVTELVAGLDVADRIDEYAAAFDHALAIRRTAVIDEARLVAVDARIDDRAVARDEQEGVPVVIALEFVATIRLGVRHPFAEVLDDARALADRARRIDPAPVNARIAYFEQRRRVRLRSVLAARPFRCDLAFLPGCHAHRSARGGAIIHDRMGGV
jgi:hypothetical protein